MGFLLTYTALGRTEGVISDLRTRVRRSSRLSASSGDGSSGAILGRERCLVKTRPGLVFPVRPPTMDEGPLGNARPAHTVEGEGGGR